METVHRAMPAVQFPNICRKELVYSVILCMGSFTFGYVLGSPAVNVPKMRDDPGGEFNGVSEGEFTLYKSISPLFAILGPVIVRAFVAPSLPFGRKTTCFILAITATGFWIIGNAATGGRFWLALLSRALLGISLGGFSALIPMYVVETAPPDLTGLFGSLPQLCISTGILVTYLVGAGLTWRWVNGLFAIWNGVLSILIWFVPESPAALNAPDPSEEKRETVFQQKWACLLTISILFPFFQQFCGITPIVMNLNEIFSQARVDMKPAWASSIATSAKVFACFIAGPLIQRWGRRVMWVISFGGLCVFEIAFAIVQHPSVNKGDRTSGTLSIIFIFLVELFFGLGAGPIQWFIVPEMFPDSVRPAAVACEVTANFVYTFLAVQLFPELKKGFGFWGAFIFFAGLSGASVVFGLFWVKEPDEQEPQVQKDIYDDLVSN
jgi:MFS family permease